MSRRMVLTAAMLSLSAGCRGGQTTLPAHGEALMVVDTDLPVPQLAGRLRVDTYAEDGTWLDSRDIGRRDPRDWPASFSVLSDDDTRDRRVLVRVRAYPEGFTRDYLGERFLPRVAFQAPHVPASLAELCASAPDLPMSGRVTMRSGNAPITELVAQGDCAPPTRSGTVAARVTIATAGAYTFDVARAEPYETQSSLFLRGTCDDPTTQSACESEPGIFPFFASHFARLDATLQPGTYYLMASVALPDWPADVTLEVTSVDGPVPPSASGVDGGPPYASTAPRLMRGDGEGGVLDESPASEPLPSTTVDRLVLVRLVPGVRGRVEVTLRGACAGTMAKLGAQPQSPDPGTAQTCIDTEGVAVPVVESPLDPDMTRPDASAQGAFGVGETCDPSPAPGASSVCVPGGVFVLGSHLVPSATSTMVDTSPERIAVVPRFWMDRTEVTVARFRAALTGAPLDPATLHANDKPLDPMASLPGGPNISPGPDYGQWCTWSLAPMGREDYPLTCASWRLARAFCQSQGGDLPTEAQWEYAASAAGRPYKTLYPWGDDDPTCARAIVQREPPQPCFDCGVGATSPTNGCVTIQGTTIVTWGPAPVTAADGHDGTPGDVTALGIVDLAGNVAEWTMDSGQSYASDCWSAAPLTSPACLEDDAPFRSYRGGAWTGTQLMTFRQRAPGEEKASGIDPYGDALGFDVGFRCVYPAAHP